MKSIAIFVEGQTELIFVREYLLKMFDYQWISIECYNLYVDSKHIPTEYPFPCESPTHRFEILNVGNDQAVLTRILNREKYLYNQGFELIIGLRDMYSKQYREVNPTPQYIHEATNQEFISTVQDTINKKALHPERIVFHFAIMEAEAWILGLDSCFMEIDKRLTHQHIEEKLGYNLSQIDPETKFFHPASEVGRIYELIESSYDKSKGDICKIMSKLNKERFIDLSNAYKCETFKAFHRSIGFGLDTATKVLGE